MGQRFAGGEDAITDFLMYLATHPDTAQHISFQLAQYFVADQPPPALVKHMQSRFIDTQGDLKTVTQAMIEHPDFAAAATRRDKFRTPYRYVVALMRASARAPQNSRPLIGTLHQLGQPLYGCITPNGWANTQDEWLSPDALTARLNFAVALGGGWLPVSQEMDDTMMDGDMSPSAGADAHHMRKRTPVDPQTVLAALGDSLPDNTVTVAKRSPPALRAAVLLGSPQMQYC